MSYEPTQWSAGDTVTSAKLNKIEQGIKNNILIANLIYDDEENDIAHLDKTWQEIHDADFCIIKNTHDNTTSIKFVIACGYELDMKTSQTIYMVAIFDPYLQEDSILQANSPNDYPSNITNESDGPVIIK